MYRLHSLVHGQMSCNPQWLSIQQVMSMDNSMESIAQLLGMLPTTMILLDGMTLMEMNFMELWDG